MKGGSGVKNPRYDEAPEDDVATTTTEPLGDGEMVLYHDHE